MIESEGVVRARRELGNADRVLLIVEDKDFSRDVMAELFDYLHSDIPVTVIRNKIDLSGQPPAIEELDRVTTVSLSAKTGQGMPLLIEHLKQAAGVATIPEGVFTARQRHLDALRRAMDAMREAGHQLQPEPRLELLAEDLRRAQTALNDITGEFTSEDLLGEIFSSFCIGK